MHLRPRRRQALERVDLLHAGEVAGESAEGRPIHHVVAGAGPVKALLVGGPHCNEPIGSMTVSGLLSLLHEGLPALLQTGVEWHVIPCIDPDGARLNEAWTQGPFDLERYMRGYYLQAPARQVELPP